jgi:hypothetical protein
VRGGGGNGRDPRRRLEGLILGSGERGNSPWNVLHGGKRSSDGGGDWLMAQREVRSIGGAHGGVGRVVLWPEVLGDGSAPMDTAAASDTLPGATALLISRSQPVLEEGVAPATQLDRALEVQRHGSSTAAARSRGTRSAWLEEESDGRASREEKNSFISSMHCSGG